MIEKEELISAIKTVKEDLINQENDLIKLGLYMSLQTIKDHITDEELLQELELDEDLEKYFNYKR